MSLDTDPAAVPATILAGQALSDSIDLAVERLHRVEVGAAWTAAALSFRVSRDGVTWADLFMDSGEYVIAQAHVAAGRAIVVDQAAFYAVRFVQLRSGTAAAAVNQVGADRVLQLVTAPR